jgi:pyruvate formate lyase activating enzyme
MRRIGQYYEVESLMEVLLRDLPFYRHSNGGVTLSGGECTLYPDYLEPLLHRLRDERIHVALQTCGLFSFEMFKQRILPYVDLVYYDLKIANAELHRKHTGRTNEQIIENLRRLVEERPAIIRPRIPLIPGVTATRRNLRAIIGILREAGARDVSLVPYNPMGIHMYECLGRPKPNLPETFMKLEEEAEIRTMFQAMLENRAEAVRIG